LKLDPIGLRPRHAVATAYNQECAKALSRLFNGDLVTHHSTRQEAPMPKKCAIIALVSLFALASCSNFDLPAIDEPKPHSPQALSRGIDLTSPDAFEQDDAQSSPKPIATDGSLYEHNFYDDANDWHSFQAISGHVYELESFVEGEADTKLYVMDGSSQLGYNDDKAYGNYGSKVRFTAPSSKTYTVRLYSYGGATGPYLGYSVSVLDTSVTQTTYTVSYSANGASSGTAPADAATYAAGATVTTKTNSGGLAKTGYTFDGWNTNASGTGTSYAAGATFAMGSANVTLYAKWSAQSTTTYTVTYNANGATSGGVPVDSAEYQTGQAVTVKSNSASYAPGASFTMGSSDVTLYAVWAETGGSSARIRIAAANTSSGNNQDYSGGHGIRMLQGVHPDVVLIQEFNYKNDTVADFQEMANLIIYGAASGGPTGEQAYWYREGKGGVGSAASIPNGIISRYPFKTSGTAPVYGEWDDTYMSDRDFAWACIDIPGSVDLWAVSLHIKASSGSADKSKRQSEATLLKNYVASNVPSGAYLVIGGDFNTYSNSTSSEPCLGVFDDFIVLPANHPRDQNGDGDTNAGRSSPYDRVLVDVDLQAYAAATVIGSYSFPYGFVLDTRVTVPYSIVSSVAPALSGDSGATSMQHMTVVRDFLIPVN
jgi:uncharacterized repeat protein (TIGR02543 family)